MATHREKLMGDKNVEKQVVMGNRKIDVQSRGREHLEFALALARNGRVLTHYVEDDGQLVLCWSAIPMDETPVPMLYPLKTTEEIAEFVWGWIQNAAVHRGKYEGGDVANEKGGFRLWTGEWGRDEKYAHGFARVEARWVWLGK